MEICRIADGSNCLVYAKFRNAQECMDTRRFMTANCDFVGTPGKIVCDTTRPSTLVVIACK